MALTDAENQRTEFEYYPDGTLKLERRPMSEETTYEYDTLGRLWKVTDAKNQTTEYGYDDQSRIETIAYADGKTVTVSYDAGGNLASYSDGTTSAAYTYDDAGRKLTETVNYGSFTKSFSSSYYGNGLKQTFTAPDNTVYTYTYGLNNELQTVQIPGVGNIGITEYTWNRPATINYPGGTQRSYTYDALMRIQSLTVLDPTSTSLLNYQYSYDEVGNILTKTTEHGNYTYGYDDVSRLLTADNPVLDDESYTYDNVGNRLTDSSVSGSWSYNTNNELLGYADVEYEYDANGNLAEVRVAGQMVWTCVYDAANRLVHVEDGTGSIAADYSYDPFGRRLWKDVGGTKTYFFYSEEGLIAEYDATGMEIKSYGYKPDSTWTTDPLWLKEGGTYYWYQNDHLGTPQKLTETDGTVVWSAQYSSFGEADVQVETVTNNLRFPGQYQDDETGLHYNFHRYYDPKIGRYLRIDPIGFNGGDMNLYEYAESSPNNAFDRYGLTTDYYIPIHPRLGSLLGTKKDIVDLETMKSHLDPFGAGLVFTCRCGWLDLGHIRHAMDRVLQWYLEIQMYSTMGSTLRGLEIDYTLERDYAPAEFIEFATMLAYKESVIHEYVSLGLQPNSAYSPEDLPSNHIGIMIAGNHVADFVPRPTVEEWVNAMDTDLKKVLEECVILSKEKSENVWEEYVKGEDKWFTPGGWIGGGTLHRRNPSHEPWIIACEECEHVEDKSYPSWFSEPYWGPIPEPWLPEP